MRAIALVFAFLLSYCNAFELMKLGEFKDQNVSGWLVSEKLDGIRAYWDGQNLLSRNGVKLVVPSEFVASFPPFALDGELFSKRGEFEKIQSIVMDKSPNLKEWQDVKFYVFDVPEASGGLLSRLEVLHKFLLKHPSQYIAVIEQIKLKDNAQLYEIYNDITQNDGEGVVIRNPKTAYIGGRSQMNLKFKSFKDDECEVIAINLGKGKYSDKMG
ncbi:DNA ligase, partial [Campylobacter majalis]|uniref:DNA ligase n=1 Tax=Campylobacter majalis TaxID=2790656 RepID=UPI001E502439